MEIGHINHIAVYENDFFRLQVVFITYSPNLIILQCIYLEADYDRWLSN